MTWFKCFIHPKRSFEELEETRRYADEMTAYAESVETQLAELQKKFDAIREENDTLLTSKSKVDEMASHLLSQLADCRRERDEYFLKFSEAEKQVAQVEEIAKMVDQFGELKQNYELRIAKLKEKLMNARLAIRQLKSEATVIMPEDDLVSIDFACRYKLNATDDMSQNPIKKDAPEKASFQSEKKVQGAAQPSLFIDEELSDSREIADDSDEWLRRLPDDFD